MANLKLQFSDVYKKVSEFLGMGSTPTGTDLTKVKDITYRGYVNFLNPIDMQDGQSYYWSFLRKYDTITTVDGQWKYSLPSDFANIYIEMIHDQQTGYPPITQVSAKSILRKRIHTIWTTYPMYFAVTTGTYTKETGSKYELWFYGDPNGTYIISYWYIFEPEKLVGDTDMFVGNVMTSEAILESALAIAENQEDDTQGLHSKLANEAIQRLIRMDKGTKANSLGKLVGGISHEYRRYLEIIDEPTVYNG